MASVSISSLGLLLYLAIAVAAAVSAGGGGPDMSIITYGERHRTRGLERGEEEVRDLYENWMARHGRIYNEIDEKERRFEIFNDNLRYIDEHNAGDHSFRLGLNRFADLTNEEYRSLHLGTRPDPRRRNPGDRYRVAADEALPDSVDWRAKGAVVPVKDQGTCGAGNAFPPFTPHCLRLRWAASLLHAMNLLTLNPHIPAGMKSLVSYKYVAPATITGGRAFSGKLGFGSHVVRVCGDDGDQGGVDGK